MVEEVTARVGVKVGDQLFELTFEAFECAGARQIEEADRRDAFYRFNHSLQHFFDSSSKVETEFAVGAGSS